MSPKMRLFTAQAVTCRLSNSDVYVQPHLCQGFLPTMQPDFLPENSEWNLGKHGSYELVTSACCDCRDAQSSVQGAGHGRAWLPI